ncbi:MAG: Toxin-antitoxin system, antitoxin component, Xre family, partial [Intestinibacter bartlettii DORA_8_9]
MNYGEKVKKIRKYFNLSQKDFGEKIGLKANSVSNIENNINTLTE